jgi:hypothetical protein
VINQNTLLLDINAVDLVIDSNGNIAMAQAPYSIAQDVASALRTNQGECIYNTSLGVPLWANILGYLPPSGYVAAKMEAQALLVPNVQRAHVTFTSFTNRSLQGQCLVTDTDNNKFVVEI